ncbi:DUF4276 family protein [Xanthomonas sp. 3075]|uniref:DUF4276 family protein n=1 Tax=Xanthomonas sp. 3075 TaxID=3035315 RepID=UPI001609B519|nr:DUF4276 family protein [Xanthomonas sp. 3075]MBB4131630.1 hypothetical protein [Xanthomonas sp. 3075]
MAGNHTRVNILVEGQTEETFVRELLAPHLASFEVWITARIIETSKGHKGGAVSYGKIVHQVKRWCQQDRQAVVTTLFDVYGLPGDFPGFMHWNPALPSPPQVNALETALAGGVNEPNLIPYLQLHEFEALLFSELTAFSYVGVPARVIDDWQTQLAQFVHPEAINNSTETAPSKRLIAGWPTYAKAKPLYGTLIALQIGLPQMRVSCPRFNAWVDRLEAL